MAESLARGARVAPPSIGMDEAAELDDIDDESSEADRVDVGDAPQADAADLAVVHLNGDDDDRPVDRRAARDAGLFLAQVGLIDLDVTSELVPVGSDHRPPQFVQPAPSGVIASQAQGALQTQRAGPRFLARDFPGGQEPQPQLPRTLEDGARRGRDLTSARRADVEAARRTPRRRGHVTMGHTKPPAHRRRSRYATHACSSGEERPELDEVAAGSRSPTG